MPSNQTTEAELSFLQNIRLAVAPETSTSRDKRDFPHVFSSIDDRRIMDRIHSRTAVDRSGLTASFIENSQPLNIRIHKAGSLSEAGDRVLEIAQESDPEFGHHKFIVQHDHPDIHSMRLWQKLAGEPIQLTTTFNGDPDLREKTVQSYIGVTSTDWGIAESATLLNYTEPGKPRSTSLVPSIHIGLLRENKILANLQEAYCMIRRRQPTPGVTLISGPSKTADIEAHMVHGAHGPREVHIVIVPENT